MSKVGRKANKTVIGLLLIKSSKLAIFFLEKLAFSLICVPRLHLFVIINLDSVLDMSVQQS